MYVSSTSPLPRNSMDAPSSSEVQRRRNAVNRINAAGVIARAIVECPPDPWAFQNLGDNLARDVANSEQQAVTAWVNPQVSGAPLASDSIPGNSLADPPVSGPAVVVQPLTAQVVSGAIAKAPKVIPLSYSQPQVSGCDIVIPLPSQRPRVQQKATILMPTAAPELPQRAGQAPMLTAPTQPVTPSVPAWSPCPPGVQFQGKYVGGAPVCGAIVGGFVRSGPSVPQAFASIVPRGVGDAPTWGNSAVPSGRAQAASGPSIGAWLFIGLGLLALARRG
jgi:hypothetical protein